MSQFDAAVIGGGVVGLSTAFRLARRGLAVALIDREPARGASWAAAGMLAPVTEAHYGEEALVRLNLEAARRYPAFIAEIEDVSGKSCGYQVCGTVMVARDGDENSALEDLYRFQQSLGLEVSRLRGREVKRLEPSLSPKVRGGVLAKGDHQVDNRALLEALVEACRRSGVSFVPDSVVAVETQGGAAGGVVLASGAIVPAPSIVVSAGARSGELKLPAAIPVRPVKGQLLHLRSREEAPLCRRNVRSPDVYVVPRADGRVVVGATVEEQGFYEPVTGLAVYELLRDSYELLPGILELEFVEVSVGFRPGSPDNAPLIGETEMPGVVLATGHFRNGVLLAPVTADAIAGVLLDGEAPAEAAAFSPRRFSARRREAS